MTPQELKLSLLGQAFQGKLVSQTSEDGTGADLLPLLQEECTQKIKSGIIKKFKPLPPISEEDLEFEVPSTWTTIRLGSVCQLLDGEKRKGFSFPYLEARYLRGKTEPTLLNEGKFVPAGTNVILVDGENSGEVFRISEAGYMGSTFKVLFTPETLLLEYVIYFLQYHKNTLRNNKKGAAIPHLNKEIFFNLVFPLPPLAEQKRIVARIEELLPYIDRYEKAWSKLEDFNKRFPADMQKSILQMAIQGKLVEQRPEEGTGEELYQQIQAEKQRLIKAGAIKKEKPLPEIVEDEISFDIPETWKWAKIGEIFTVVRGSSPRPKGSPLYWSSTPTQHHWVTIKDISSFAQNGMLYQTHEFLTNEGATKSTFVPAEELIIAVSGSTTGKFCILGIDGYIYDGLAAVLNQTKIISNQFLRYFFMWVYERLNAQKVGSAFPNINTDMLKNTLIPLPPLEEQKRIVAKLEEILPLCDCLK